MDLVINNENMEAFVYRNTASEKLKNSFLKVALKGTGQNTFGFGARVTIYIQGKSRYCNKCLAGVLRVQLSRF
jgi:hypothetical protein